MNLKHYDQFEKLPVTASEWNDLLERSITKSPFLRYEFMKTWWDHKGGGEWPEDAQLVLIEGREGNDLVGLAPLFIATTIDGKRTLYNLGAIEICDVLDVIVTQPHHSVFCAAVVDYLSGISTTFDDVKLFNLPVNSPTIATLQGGLESSGLKTELAKYQPSPTIHLVNDFEEYLSGIDKKQRHEVRRKMRRAEESGRGVEWHYIEKAEELETAISAFFALMEGDADKAAFLTVKMRAQMEAIIRLAFDEGFLKFAFLKADGQVAASYLMFDMFNKLWVYNSGYDRAFNELSAGWVLLGHLIQWSCENGRAEFDFMRGDEDYKFKFGAIDRPVMVLTAVRA